jgi:hypothetical protein
MSSESGRERKLKVHIIGIINDTKFTAQVEGTASEGRSSLHLDYTEVPKGWHPLIYSDPLINLSFLKEFNGARCLGMLTDTNYRAERVFDFGKGFQLRGLAKIHREGNVVVGAYSMHGVVHVTNLVGVEPFEEVMIPSGPGNAVGVGVLRLLAENKETIEGIVSTRYFFDEKVRVPFPQIRRSKIDARVRENVFSGEFSMTVRPMPAMQRESPYIGHMSE